MYTIVVCTIKSTKKHFLTLQEALNILETAIRTLKNQSHEQRIPDAIFADGIRSLENRKLKLRPEPVKYKSHYGVISNLTAQLTVYSAVSLVFIYLEPML